MTPEEQARKLIDAKLTASGWIVQAYKHMNLAAGPGLAVTEFPGARGPADYLLYVGGKAIGVVEAKPAGYPNTTQDSLPTAGYALSGGIDPLGSCERFLFTMS